VLVQHHRDADFLGVLRSLNCRIGPPDLHGDNRSSSGGRFATIRPMVIVVDTNVFIGACLGVGASNAVVAACLRGIHRPLMGSALLAEYEDVLARKALFARSRLTPAEREELLDIFLAECRWTRIYFGWRPNLRDEADNHLVELAVAGDASHIVTRNAADFERMELRLPDLLISTPEKFLRETRK
jgi:predicted nucleic acid-binding protein